MARSVRLGSVAMLLIPAVLLLLGATARAQAKVLRLGRNPLAAGPTHEGSLKFAELVKQKTGGKFEVSVYPANQLGGNREMVEQVKIGSLDMTLQGLGILGYALEDYMVVQSPFMFRSQAHIHKAIEGEIGRELADKLLRTQGIRLLTQLWDRLPRHFTANKPLDKPEDMTGLVVRIGGPFAEFYRLIGAKATVIPLNEMYLAFKQGVAHVSELPLDYIYDHSIYEAHKVLTANYHTYGTQMIAMNEKVFQSLGPDGQRVVLEAAAEAGRHNNTLTWEQEDDYVKKLQDRGMRIVKPDREPFVEALRKAWPQMEKKWPKAKGLYERIQAVR